ncbi:SMCs flexible hinge [Chytridium lagenaria]|nr:SMCs flexible hinge [Chytridium lagenaria]
MLESVRDELAKAEQRLMSAMDRNVASALQAIKTIAKKHGLKGVYGPMYELFTVDDRYKTAVEVVGGGEDLFHVVVDTDETASFLLEVLNRDRLGRVTFMPLNRLNRKRPGIRPPMMPFDFEKAEVRPGSPQSFCAGFGRAIVCPSLEIASHYARHDGINTVTLEGDRADKKGTLSGGFVDNRKSKLEAAKVVRTSRAKFDEESEKIERIKSDAARVDQQITGILDRLASLEKQKNQAAGNLDPMQLEIRQKLKEIEEVNDLTGKKDAALTAIKTSVKVLSGQVSSLEKELKSPLQKSLTNEEISRLETIVPELETFERRLK